MTPLRERDILRLTPHHLQSEVREAIEGLKRAVTSSPRHPHDLARLRRACQAIWSAALRAVDPVSLVRSALSCSGPWVRVSGSRYWLPRGSRVFIVAAGKAAAPMARAAEARLGHRVAGGIAVVKEGHGLPLCKCEVLEAGHPFPDARGARAARRVEALLRTSRLGPRDLVLCLLSGGASSLLVAPASGISLAEKRSLTRRLLGSGAPVGEINCVRKHLSRLKGGRLAVLAAPARVGCLLLSDVVGDDPATIASGPTSPDPSTFGEALAVLRRRLPPGAVPPAVCRLLRRGARGEESETPKPGDPLFRRVRNRIVGTNRLALAAAARAARRQGFRPLVLTSSLEGEAREVGKALASLARVVAKSGCPIAPPACLLLGGETTVTLRGRGRGGRNQEVALAAVRGLAGLDRPALVASVGTDGTDGPTDAAGAWADTDTLRRAQERGLPPPEEFLQDNDSYRFFEPLGTLIRTGPTRTNVMDILLVLVT